MQPKGPLVLAASVDMVHETVTTSSGGSLCGDGFGHLLEGCFRGWVAAGFGEELDAYVAALLGLFVGLFHLDRKP